MKTNLEVLFTKLPLRQIDYRLHCDCEECSKGNEDCCIRCNSWRRIEAKRFAVNHRRELEAHDMILLWAYHSELVLKNVAEMRELFRAAMRREFVEAAQNVLGAIRGRYQEFVGVHVRRTDYLGYIKAQWLHFRAFFKAIFLAGLSANLDLGLQ